MRLAWVPEPTGHLSVLSDELEDFQEVPSPSRPSPDLTLVESGKMRQQY